MKIKNLINFGHYPFFVGVKSKKKFSNIPPALPFKISIDKETTLATLQINNQIKIALKKAYGQGSMLSTPLGKGELGNYRMNEFLDSLKKEIKEIKGKKILELGSGEGHLLVALKKLGAKVEGIEIGPQGKKVQKTHDIKVYNKTLETINFKKDTFDAIISYGCLEHIIDIKRTLLESARILKDRGVFFHSVPNTDNTLKKLRLDDLCHQHVNYFTSKNVKILLSKYNFKNIKTLTTKAGNEFHIIAKQSKNKSKKVFVKNYQIKNAYYEWRLFLERFYNIKNNFKKNISKLIDQKKSKIGFYAGGHVILQISNMQNKVYYFDSDNKKHGLSWLPGFPIINSPKKLKNMSIDYLFIAPEHHIKIISKSLLKNTNLKKNKILPISKLYKK